MYIKKIFKRLIENKIVDLLILLSFSLFTCRDLFTTKAFISGTDFLDTKFWIDQVWAFPQNWLSTWFPYTSCGYSVTPMKPLFIIIGFPLLFHYAWKEIIVKILIIFIYLLSSFSMYYFTYRLTKSRVAALISGLFFMYNQFFLSELVSEGHLTKSIGYAFLPLIFLMLEKALETPKITNILGLSIVLTFFLSSGIDQPVYIAIGFSILYILFWSLYKNPEKRKRVKISLRVSLLTISISSLLSAYWLLPEVVTSKSYNILFTVFQRIDEAYFFSLKSLKDAFTLRLSTESLGAQRIPYWELPQLQHLFVNGLIFLIPILAFLAILIHRDRLTAFLTVSAIASNFLAVGPYFLPEQLFTWLWLNIPGYSTFRVSSRFLMMTAFSYSYLIGVSVGWIHDKITYLCANPSGKSVTKLLDKVFIVAILLFILLYSWSGSIIGVQTYNWPDEYVKPYEYIENLPGDFRILPIPYGRRMSDMYSWSGGLSLGFYSYGIDNKRVFTSGGTYWGGAIGYNDEFNYFARTLITQNMTDKIGSILGLANVKYIVLEPSASAQELAFFDGEKGLTQTPFIGDAKILQNDLSSPAIFSAQKSAIVIGGRDTINSLLNIDGFNLSQYALFFYDQTSVPTSSVNSIIFSTNDISDFIFARPSGNCISVNAAGYAFPSLNASKYWVSSDSLLNEGEMVLGRKTLQTCGDVNVVIPLKIQETAEYELWIRIAYMSNRGKLSIKIDNQDLLSGLSPLSYYPTFRWIKISTMYLAEGVHDLILINDGSGYNDIDQIALINPKDFQNYYEQALSSISNSKIRILYVLEAEKAFADNLDNWRFSNYWGCYASNGYTLESNTIAEGLTKLFVPRSGNYKIAFKTFKVQGGGNLILEVDDHRFEVNSASLLSSDWNEVGPIKIESGEHVLGIINDGTGKIDLDEIVVYSVDEDEENTSLKDVFSTSTIAQITYKQNSPTEYEIHVTADKPFWLILGESYHPLWKVYINGKSVDSTVAYSFINGFQINEIGNQKITIYFTGQTYAYIGALVSVASFIAIIFYLAHMKWRNVFHIFRVHYSSKKDSPRRKSLAIATKD